MPTMSSPAHINLLERANSISEELVRTRRHIHSHPELSFGESQTAALVAERMRALGFQVKEKVGGTGVVAEIGTGGKTVCIRADMDALPIEEANEVTYCSQNKGVMHACGHDAHVTCALGAASLLSELFSSQKLDGKIRFIFQPAEELTNEQGKSGATLMLEEGCVADADALIGLHVDPRLPVGMIAVRDGALLAACDSFDAKIKGRGGHGAYPEYAVDAVVLSSYVVQALQTVISRRKPAIEPAVLTIGGIRSTTYRPNIVAAEVEITGTVRYFSEAIGKMARQEVEKAMSIVESLGGSYELNYSFDSPPLINDPQVSNAVRQVAAELLGADNVISIDPQLGADDFAFFTPHVSSCYFVLGVKIGDGAPREIHSPTFDINEGALPIGAAMLAQTALHLL